MKTILETKRLLLREYSIEDIEAVYELNSNLEVQKYTGDVLVKSREEAESIITKLAIPDYQKYGYGRWATIYKPDQKIIGFAGLKYLPEFRETDIGFRFLPEYWNKGIATEISKAILSYGFDQLSLEKIIGIAMPDNIASCTVLEKIGMQLYQQIPYDEESGICNWYQIFNQELRS